MISLILNEKAMRHTKKKFITINLLALLVLSSCDDFFIKDISDKTIQVVCPLDKSELSLNQQSFVWAEEEGVEKYHVVIVSPSFKNIQRYVCDSLITNYKMELNLPMGDYQWSIQGVNSEYKSLINYLSFKILDDEK